MFHLSSIALRLPRVAGNARWIFAGACGLGSLLAAAPTAASRLASLSSFVHVEPGAGAAITGLVIAGSTEKILLVRGLGPSLRQFGMNDGLADPVLRVFDSAGRELGRNRSWFLERNADEIRRVTAEVGALPLSADSADAALLVRLAPGAYTLAVDSATDHAGAVLTEVYEAGCAGALANLATIASLTVTHPVFFGTFRVTGTASKKFLIRAVGPALGAMGVGGALPDPMLTLYREAGAAATARNDDWCESIMNDTEPDTIATSTIASGAFALPAEGKDAALVVTLAPGSYTAQVTGKGADTGLVLLEIYAVP